MQNSIPDLGSLVYSTQIAVPVLCDLRANAEVQNLHDMLYMCNNMQSVFLRLKWLPAQQINKINLFFLLFLVVISLD